MHHYRPDIDGLRAVAILPVVLFHAGLGGLSGGFVGVDVFFVISGFLITRLIREEIDAGTFSLANFYERRIRRLFPALFAMLLLTSLAAIWLLLPADLADFGKSVAATSLFASNFLFWQELGYFGRAAEETPLLHTWSLAVEEQFYVLYPLFLVFVAARLGRRYVAATATVTAVSFLFSVTAVAMHWDAAFYLAPSRAWELGTGALLALGAVPAWRTWRVRTLAALLGAAAIGWSVVVYSPATAFPGAAALVPCLGTAAVLWAGSGGRNLVGDALSTRPVVLVGLVSYSLYLWHWPLLALVRYYLVRELTATETSVVLAVSAVAAIASWRFVERPFRGKSGILERRQLFVATLAVMGVIATIGVGAIVAEGWPMRLDADVRRIIDGANDRRSHQWKCGNVAPSAARAGHLCLTGSESAGKPAFIIWGDSHARVLVDAVGAAATRRGMAGEIAVRVGCAPLIGAARVARDEDQECVAFNEAVVDHISVSPEITDVVLAGRWGLMAEALRYGREPGATVFLTDSSSQETSRAESRRVFARSLRRSVETLVGLGKRVWIVASVPEIGWDVPSVMARSLRFDRKVPPAPSRADYAVRQAFVLATLDELDALPGVETLRPDETLCGDGRCRVTRDGRPLYFDTHHLTRTGAAQLEPMFAAIFAH